MSTEETKITTRSAYSGTIIYIASKNTENTFESVLFSPTSVTEKLKSESFKTESDQEVVLAVPTPDNPAAPRSSCAEMVLKKLIKEGDQIMAVQKALSVGFSAAVSADFQLNITIATQEKCFAAKGYAEIDHVNLKISFPLGTNHMHHIW